MLVVQSLPILLATISFATGHVTNVNKSHLNIAVAHIPPYTMIELDPLTGNVTFEGPFIQIGDWLSQRLHFTYTLIPLARLTRACPTCSVDLRTSNPIGKFARRKNLDMLLPQFGMSFARYRMIDYTACTAKPDSAFVLPAAESESFLWAPIKPYEKPVWTAIMISGFVVTIVLVLTRKSSNPGRQGIMEHISNLHIEAMHVFSVLVNQGDVSFYNDNRRKWAFRFIGAVWTIMAIVLINAYSGNLISYMTRPSVKHYPQHESELVRENFPLEYAVLNNSVGVELLKSARSGTLKLLADRLKANPKLIAPNRRSAFLLVASGCCAYNDVLPYIERFAVEDYKKTGKCRISLGRVTRGFVNSAVVLQKNSPHTHPVSLALMHLTEVGLIARWESQYSQKSACLSNKVPAPERRILRLDDLHFPLVLLLIGIAFSFAVCLVELYLGLRTKRNRSRHQVEN